MKPFGCLGGSQITLIIFVVAPVARKFSGSDGIDSSVRTIISSEKSLFSPSSTTSACTVKEYSLKGSRLFT